MVAPKQPNDPVELNAAAAETSTHLAMAVFAMSNVVNSLGFKVEVANEDPRVVRFVHPVAGVVAVVNPEGDVLLSPRADAIPGLRLILEVSYKLYRLLLV
jgi:hypothetical protein